MGKKVLIRHLDETVKSHGSKEFGKYKAGTRWRDLSWRLFRLYCLRVGEYLKNVHPASRPIVGIWSSTRFEWNVCDIATLSVHGIVVGLYANDSIQQIQYIINHSGIDIMFIETEEMLSRLQAVDARWGREKHVVLMEEGSANEFTHRLKTWMEEETAEPDQLEENRNRFLEGIQEDDVASYIYTSGTSGIPKGVILTHGNLLHAAKTYSRHIPFDHHDSVLYFLPFSHVFARVMFYGGIFVGIRNFYAENTATVGKNLKELSPSTTLVVPRVLEKIQSAILSNVQKGGRWNELVFRWACRIGRLFYLEKRPSWTIFPLWFLADKLVFSKIRRQLGENMQYIGCGGGHLPKELADFYLQFGIKVFEGYATTESGGLGVFNTPGCYKTGSVGKPVPEMNVRLKDDGEILLQGDSLFQGYLKDEDGTREVLSEGWYATGDIGEFDQEGFLKIVDRKKELIMTSYGKKIAPSAIEAMLVQIPLIDNALVVGENRQYLVALININSAVVQGHPGFNYLKGTDAKALSQDKELMQALELEIDQVNQALARHESIKKFAVVEPFDIGSGTLTSTLKKKRKVILEMYKPLVESLYSDSQN